MIANKGLLILQEIAEKYHAFIYSFLIKKIIYKNLRFACAEKFVNKFFHNNSLNKI
ncbi:hypothetical protein PRO82_000704 [Candidatus Protochlamydia amoebophila]|nr:hypothetical protein [Candidatus Protochlamydia amoebophila]